jgi:hypothetical protein
VPNTPLTRRQGGLLAKLILIGLFVNLGVIGYVFYQSYAGREAVVKASRRGCDRSKRDREANAIGWRTAEVARLHGVARQLHISLGDAEALIQQKPQPGDLTDLTAARKYDQIAKGLEERSRISCSKAFPKAGLLP